MTFQVELGSLTAIIGTVGSGKSSLLLTLLGELPNVKGDVNITGKIFYVSQEAWIYSSTIRQNILFGKQYDEERFNEIIEACALKDVRCLSTHLRLICCFDLIMELNKGP